MKTWLALVVVSSSCFSQAPLPGPSAPAPVLAQVDETGRPFHLVQPGDSLTTIALTYGLKVSTLIELNQLRNNTIYLEQRLYLAPKGTQMEAPGLPPQEANQPQEASDTAPDGMVQPSTDFVASRGSASQAPQVVMVMTDSAKRNPSPGPGPRATTPPTTIIHNPDADLLHPADPTLQRVPVSGSIPAPVHLTSLFSPLPILDLGTPRTEWTDRQTNIATWWEKQVIHTTGIARSVQWISGPSGSQLVFHVSPSGAIPSTIRVIIPGAFLPSSFDGARLKRLTATGTAIRILGHLQYLDGPEPIELMRSGHLMSPWAILAESAFILAPATGWERITEQPVDGVAP